MNDRWCARCEHRIHDAGLCPGQWVQWFPTGVQRAIPFSDMQHVPCPCEDAGKVDYQP